MIKYWPKYQGIELNKQVANLFYGTRQKCSNKLSNETYDILYLDLLDYKNKKKLFLTVLVELEILVLDIVELGLKVDSISLLNYKILYDLIQKSLTRFLFQMKSKNFEMKTCNAYYYQIILIEHRLLLEYVLVYLIYGTSKIKKSVCLFNISNTPAHYVSILFENLVIQISDIVVSTLFQKTESLFSIGNFFDDYPFCNNTYLSLRSLALFKNTLLIQNFVCLYFIQPKSIYSSRYKVWLISSTGLVSKYIFICRSDNIDNLSKVQLLVLLFIELQDVVIPKVERFLLIFSKIFLHVFINILGNSVIFCIRFITFGINGFCK
uniref:Conserved hypothetical plastid protein n=1 Tax=Caulacanthus okamurae TaxID=152008 RepID=A0A6H1U6S3_9FLOR|nr:conserved hypothetical plastid protein [Caulacanthus okamurae]QIZ74582.1 conserved hypothetical plastid protein [Caulacanthus okamurae]